VRSLVDYGEAHGDQAEGRDDKRRLDDATDGATQPSDLIVAAYRDPIGDSGGVVHDERVVPARRQCR